MKTLMALALVMMSAASAAAQPKAPLSALEFLAGEWEAIGTAPGESGRFGFAFAVQGRVLVRTNDAEYAASDRGPASRHDDLMVIYAEGGAIKADYFDNEDHIIRYTAQVRGAKDVVFVSDARASEPRYRLSYSIGADGLLKGQFEIAPPGVPDAFKSYLAWTSRKRP
ncbi:MAG: hypothetical protein LAO77_24260 [Acidobacteriia bacterium]|nr:hypothetical protein [Terriglobia bacterium]